MPERALGEGDLFGVRAIEKGFYGGVAQSTPTTAANSPQQSPTIAASDGSPITDNTSAGSSIHDDFSLSPPGDTRAASRSKSQILRLQPSEAELSGRRNHDPSLAMSAYLPPPPLGTEASKETKSATERVAVSQPSLPPNSNPQVQSYAQWRLSQAGKNNVRSILRSDSQPSGVISKPKSIYVSRGTNPEPETHVPSQPSSFPSNEERRPDWNAQIRASRRKSRGVSALDGSNQLHLLRDTPDGFVLPLAPPPIPLRNPSRQSRSSESADSGSDTDSGRSNLNYSKSAKDIAIESSIRASRRRSRSQPKEMDHKRLSSSASGKSLRNVRDSLRHNRESSSETIAERRISRQRDTIHYDPRPLHRSVSGVVVGRSVDFDNPRNSPFDDLANVSQEFSPESASSSSLSSGKSRSRSRSSSGGNKDRVKNLSLEYTHWMMKSNILSEGGEHRR